MKYKAVIARVIRNVLGNEQKELRKFERFSALKSIHQYDEKWLQVLLIRGFRRERLHGLEVGGEDRQNGESADIVLKRGDMRVATLELKAGTTNPLLTRKAMKDLDRNRHKHCNERRLAVLVWSSKKEDNQGWAEELSRNSGVGAPTLVWSDEYDEIHLACYLFECSARFSAVAA